MNNAVDFLRAAVPWISIGLLLAVTFVRFNQKTEAAKQSEDGDSKKKEEDYATLGMCFGLSFGILLANIWGVSLGVGMCIGMCVGMSIGMCIKKEPKDGEGDDETNRV